MDSCISVLESELGVGVEGGAGAEEADDRPDSSSNPRILGKFNPSDGRFEFLFVDCDGDGETALATGCVSDWLIDRPFCGLGYAAVL